MIASALPLVRRRGLRVGVLSNAPSNLIEFLERLGIAPHLDFTVVSALEGVKKPDRRIFEAALADAGVQAGEALMVGDSLKADVEGALAVGMRAVWLRRSGDAPAVRPPSVPIIARLHELPPLILPAG